MFCDEMSCLCMFVVTVWCLSLHWCLVSSFVLCNCGPQLSRKCTYDQYPTSLLLHDLISLWPHSALYTCIIICAQLPYLSQSFSASLFMFLPMAHFSIPPLLLTCPIHSIYLSMMVLMSDLVHPQLCQSFLFSLNTTLSTFLTALLPLPPVYPPVPSLGLIVQQSLPCRILKLQILIAMQRSPRKPISIVQFCLGVIKPVTTGQAC